MRRLPVIFALDVSESMVGDNHTKLEEGLARIVRELRQDPHALESVYLSVIAFAGKPRTLVPLVELAEFAAPELPIGSGTALGKALLHLMREIDRNVRPASSTQKVYWKPLVFLMTDGYPTENSESAVEKWTAEYRSKASLVAISIGHDADLNALNRLTDDVLVLEDTSNTDLVAVIKWISQSIQAHSRALEMPGTSSGPKAEEAGLKRIDLSKSPQSRSGSGLDERFAIIVGQCQNRKLPYIFKYERLEEPLRTADPKIDQLFSKRQYDLTVVQPLRRSYFEMSADDGASPTSISLDFLRGSSACPHCANRVGLAVCQCGSVFCISGEGPQTCPWCENTGTYGMVEDDGADLTIRRTQG
jgi:uncharacterized protein YegL